MRYVYQNQPSELEILVCSWLHIRSVPLFPDPVKSTMNEKARAARRNPPDKIPESYYRRGAGSRSRVRASSSPNFRGADCGALTEFEPRPAVRLILDCVPNRR